MLDLPLDPLAARVADLVLEVISILWAMVCVLFEENRPGRVRYVDAAILETAVDGAVDPVRGREELGVVSHQKKSASCRELSPNLVKYASGPGSESTPVTAAAVATKSALARSTSLP